MKPPAPTLFSDFTLCSHSFMAASCHFACRISDKRPDIYTESAPPITSGLLSYATCTHTVGADAGLAGVQSERVTSGQQVTDGPELQDEAQPQQLVGFLQVLSVRKTRRLTSMCLQKQAGGAGGGAATPAHRWSVCSTALQAAGSKPHLVIFMMAKDF